jgi:hypothetical protein
MSDQYGWLLGFPGTRRVPLLGIDNAFVVQPRQRGPALDRRILTRAAEFEATMIQLIGMGLQDNPWTGLLYLMGWGDPHEFTPLQIGETERRGTSHELSWNVVNVRCNLEQFARWGHGLGAHLGDLSHAVFGFAAYRGPTRKYWRWAETCSRRSTRRIYGHLS